MRYYSREQVIEILGVDEGFLLELEREEILYCDDPEHAGRYSEQMLERARVADNLVHELEVNLPGVAVIVRMREHLAELRHHVEDLAAELRTRR